MRRACRGPAARSSGQHPDPAPLTLRFRDPDLSCSRRDVGAQTDQLVGRAGELDSLARALAELDQGRSVATLLVGEPGIGKTRLLAEFGARADAEGHLVLSGSASELERDLPFSLFVDALDEYARGVEPGLIAPLEEDVQTELAHVFLERRYEP